jgi:hypothetical protein
MRLGLGGETVPAITLDSLNLTNVSVLKVSSSAAHSHQQQLHAACIHQVHVSDTFC